MFFYYYYCCTSFFVILTIFLNVNWDNSMLALQDTRPPSVSPRPGRTTLSGLTSDWYRLPPLQRWDRLELPPLYLRDYVKNKPHYAAFDWSSVKIGCQRIRMALCSTNSQCSLVRVGWELGSLSSLPLQAIALKVNAGPMFGNTLFQLPVEETVILVTPGYVGDTRNEDATIRLKL